MTVFTANVLLALFFAMLYEFTLANIVVGFVLGYVLLRCSQLPGTSRSSYFVQAPRLISLTVYFVAELVIANVKMAIWTLTPLSRLRPMILAVPLAEDLTPLEMTVLANMITLTPGTLSLDVSDDRRALFVHFMHVEDPDAEIAAIKDGFERRLLGVTRPQTEADGAAAPGAARPTPARPMGPAPESHR